MGLATMNRSEILTSAVRPLVTLSLVAGFVYGFAIGKISGEMFAQTAATVFAFWFAQRQAEKAEARKDAANGKTISAITTTTIEKEVQRETIPSPGAAAPGPAAGE